MKKLLTGLTVLSMLAAAFVISMQPSEASSTIYVGPSEVYTTIQSAVIAATDGDTIIVRDGIYYETIIINTRLTIRSENGPANCILKGDNNVMNPPEYIVNVTTNSVNVSGFTFDTFSGMGLYLRHVGNCNISDNLFLNCTYGLYLRYSHLNRIGGNTFLDNIHGIYLDYSTENTITDNEIASNWIGISNEMINATFVRYSHAHYNNIYGNGYYGITGEGYIHAEYNWWGDPSGPAELGPGVGDKVSVGVDFDPWLGAYIEEEHTEALTPGTTTVDASDDSDTVIEVEVSSSTNITVVAYGEVNPTSDDLPGGIKGVGTYIDVIIEDESAIVFPVNISIYYTQDDLDALGITEQQIDGMYYYDESAGMWQRYTIWGVDTTDVVLGGTAYQGHVWALAENPDQLSPKVIGAYDIVPKVTIKPETLNLKSKGLLTAVITLPDGYNNEDINISTVECLGAMAIMGKNTGKNKYIAKFDRKDLSDLEPGDNVAIIVTGKLYDGMAFKGIDYIRVI